MVDVDRRMPGLSPAHAAGLRRLSTRAAAAPSLPPPAPRNGLLPLFPLAQDLVSHLSSSGIPLNPGLSDAEFARIEAELGFSFPPDLRAILALAVPAAPGFPDWRSLPSLRASFGLPLAAASLQVARGAFWPRAWGPRPADPEGALRAARAALRRAPPLLPLFDRCYVPSRPSLAGNPIFFVHESHISCCALDLADFFRREAAFQHLPLRRQRSASSAERPPPPPSSRRSLDSVAGKPPRWIEFWSDAAASDRRRSISSSSSPPPPDPERFVEKRPPNVPEWVGSYLDKIGSVLRQGGWGESDVSEMVDAPAAGVSEGYDALVVVDSQSLLDTLLLKADRCSDSLRRAGWTAEEVSEVLGIGFLRWRPRRPPVKLPPEIALKIEKLAKVVSRSS